MWYRACLSKDGRPCRKKVQEDDQNPGLYSCRCGKRNIPETETELRFMVNMNIMDTTSHVWAVMVDAVTLLQKTSEILEGAMNSICSWLRLTMEHEEMFGGVVLLSG